MKKLSIFLAVLMSGCVAHAQSILFTTAPPVYMRDSTHLSITANDPAAPLTATYTWTFDDSTTQYGQTVTHNFTADNSSVATFQYTVEVSDAGGYTNTGVGGAGYPNVFNCAYLHQPQWSNYTGDIASQPNLHDGGSVMLYLGNAFTYSSPAYTWLNYNVHLDWGNGHSFTGIATPDTPDVYTMKVGGYGISGTDSSQSSHYRYGGQYYITANTWYSYDTLTCPATNMVPFALTVNGPMAQPLISGSRNYCVGDTLRLICSDSTTQFHNMEHWMSLDLSTLTCGQAMPYQLSAISGTSTTVGLAFEWLDPNGTDTWADTTRTINALTLDDSGIYRFIIHDGAEITNDTFLVHITVSNAPPTAGTISGTPAILAGGTTALTNATGGGVWSSDNTSVATVSASGVVTGVAAGTANISYTVTNGCGTDVATYAITVNGVAGVTDPSAGNSRVSVYPNPVSGMIHIHLEGTYSTGSGNITFRDVLGKTVVERSITGPDTQINISTLPKGVYMLTISGGDISYSGKIVVE